eukprot:Awhi_evm1s11717
MVFVKFLFSNLALLFTLATANNWKDLDPRNLLGPAKATHINCPHLACNVESQRFSSIVDCINHFEGENFDFNALNFHKGRCCIKKCSSGNVDGKPAVTVKIDSHDINWEKYYDADRAAAPEVQNFWPVRPVERNEYKHITCSGSFLGCHRGVPSDYIIFVGRKITVEGCYIEGLHRGYDFNVLNFRDGECCFHKCPKDQPVSYSSTGSQYAMFIDRSEVTSGIHEFS